MNSANKLLEYNFDFNNKTDEHPLTCAVRNDSIDKVKFALGIEDIDINSTNLDHAPPICIALHHKNEKIIDLLLSRKDLNINVNSYLGSPLTIALSLCNQEIIDRVLNFKDIDINLESSMGSPLYIIFKKGDYELYNQISSRNDLLFQGSKLRNPFVAACESGNMKIVIDLFEKMKIDLNEESIEGTALYVASKNNQIGIVRFLVEHGSDINKGFNDISPLFIACEKNHIEIVHFLLSFDKIDTSSPLRSIEEPKKKMVIMSNIYYFHPIIKQQEKIAKKCEHKCLLSMAIESRNKELVDLLFNSGKMKFSEHDLLASLNKACQVCNYEMIEQLLKIDDLSVQRSSKLLINSIIEGKNEVAELLLKNPKIDVNQVLDDTNPILYAISSSDHKLFDSLVKHPMIDLNIGSTPLNNSDILQNPLMLACKNRNIEFVRKLIDIQSIDPNIIATNQSALLIAIKQNNAEIVSLLLSHPNINANILVPIEKDMPVTPLIMACKQEKKEIVQILCNHRGIDVNKEANGVNPLIITCKTGNIEIFDILINHPDIDVNARGCKESPIEITFSSSNNYMIQKLMSFKDLDLNVHSESNLLISAVKRSKTEWVEHIISCPNLDPNIIINKYSALSYACKDRKPEIVKLLLKHPSIDVNQKHKNPLKLAIKNGSIEIVKILLNHPKINANAANGILQAAIKSKSLEIFQLMINRDDININQVYNERTALSFSCLEGSLDFINILLQRPGILVNLGKIHPLESCCESMSLNCFNLMLSHPSIDFSIHGKLLHIILADELVSFAECLLANHNFIDNIDPVAFNQTISTLKLSLPKSKKVPVGLTSIKAKNIPSSMKNSGPEHSDDVIQILSSILSVPIKLTSESLNNLLMIGLNLKVASFIKRIFLMESFDPFLLINSFGEFEILLQRISTYQNDELLNILFNLPSTQIDSTTALKFAIDNDELDIFNKWIEKKLVDVNIGQILLLAIEKSNDYYIEKLLDHPDIKIGTLEFNYFCSKLKHHKYIKKVILSSKFDINSVTKVESYLIKIIQTNDSETFMFLLDHFKGQVDFAECLYEACLINNEEIINYILNYDNVKVSVDGLINAIKAQNLSVTRKLIDYGGFDINSCGFDNNTPLKCAIQAKNISILKTVISAPCININYYEPPKKKDNNLSDLDVPLSLAMRENFMEAVDLLLSSPSIIIEGVNSQSIYKEVLRSSNKEVFIDKIMSCKYFDARRSSLLSSAILNRKSDLVERLLSIEGLDINYHYMNIIPPLSSAVKVEDIGLVKRILEFPGIKVNFEEVTESPLFFAMQSKNIEIMNLLLEFPGVDKSALGEIQNKKDPIYNIYKKYVI